jgi:hypothetical protein
MKFVATKTADQLDLQALHWVRERGHVRGDGSFPRKRSPGAGDGGAANHCQPRLLLMAQLSQLADAGVGYPGICNGPATEVAAGEK